MSNTPNLARTFYEAIIAASYINDEYIRDRLFEELAATNLLIRAAAHRAEPENEQASPERVAKLREKIFPSLADQVDRRV